MSGPGDVLASRYTLLRQAWSTPKGPVWQARDATLDRRVHVLLLDERFREDRAARRAFIDEAAQLAALSDPYLAAVYDIGTDPPFVVFEDAGGGRLSDRLRAGPLEATMAARVAANVARGIQALEQRAEAVPAITPEAVLLSSDGRGKLNTISSPAEGTDPRRELAALTVLMFTGDEPVEDRVPRKALPPSLTEICNRMLQGQSTALDQFVDACGSLTRPEPVKERARERASRSSDLGWLFAVVLVVILAVVAVVVGPGLIDRANREDETPGPTPTESVPSGGELEVASITDFDPDGNGEEHPNQVGRAIDGDPLSAWTTVGYKQDSLGKPGVGLLLDLGSEVAVSEVQVATSLPGWEAEIRIASQEPEASGDLETVTSFTAGSETSVKLPAGTSTRFLLVWITKLADDAGESDFPYRASINELVLIG